MTRMIAPLALALLLLCPLLTWGAQAAGRALPPADVLAHYELYTGVRLVDVGRGLSPARSIIRDVTPDPARTRVYWSPDGRYMTYLEVDTIVIADGYGQPLAVYPGAFGGTEFIPAWRPDSSGFAFAGASIGVDNISFYAVADGNFRLLTEIPGALEYAPLWSPDGELLLYTMFDTASGHSTLRLFDPDNPAVPPRRLQEGAIFHYQPAWSPDGRYIAFVDVNDYNERELKVYDLFTGAVTRPIDSDNMNNLIPAWRDHLLTWIGAHNVYGIGVYVYDFAGGSVLTTLPTLTTFFDWSPAQRWLVYLDGVDMRLLNIDSGTDRWLTQRYDARDADINGVAWSPDGGSLAVGLIDNAGINVYLIDAATGALRRLTANGRALAPVWRPAPQRAEIRERSG